MSNLNQLFKRKNQPSLRPNSHPNLRPSSSFSSSSSSSRPTLESEDSGTGLTGLTSKNNDGKIILMFNYFKEKLK